MVKRFDHYKGGYLDFHDLGFAQTRIDHLNSTKIVGVVEKDKQFCLSSLIDFGLERAIPQVYLSRPEDWCIIIATKYRGRFSPLARHFA
jgi:hypothetical protein